ncbi:helix-turn-helix domain-containing protein [Nocardioides sp. R-C-SC26]|uniref:helix-turn-helix domain-containing protein n=1 Tax=Nocardioides sp. R-C-SC26 TaxID=2870414 RepID=UPI001E368875|nr:helix-turn-helix transcriptional regulator [Nocardioides sp. R-C-SC26]
MTEQDARDFVSALGAEIAYWRRVRGLSRDQLAARVDISATTLGRIERGSIDSAAPTPDVWRIAAALGLQFSDLVRRTEDAMGMAAGESEPVAAHDSEGTIEEEQEAPDFP